MKQSKIYNKESKPNCTDKRDVAKPNISCSSMLPCFQNYSNSKVGKLDYKENLQPKVYKEIALILLTHTRTKPGTVMIKRCNAPLASTAMLTSECLLVIAFPTIA